LSAAWMVTRGGLTLPHVPSSDATDGHPGRSHPPSCPLWWRHWWSPGAVSPSLVSPLVMPLMVTRGGLTLPHVPSTETLTIFSLKPKWTCRCIKHKISGIT